MALSKPVHVPHGQLWRAWTSFRMPKRVALTTRTSSSTRTGHNIGFGGVSCTTRRASTSRQLAKPCEATSGDVWTLATTRSTRKTASTPRTLSDQASSVRPHLRTRGTTRTTVRSRTKRISSRRASEAKCQLVAGRSRCACLAACFGARADQAGQEQHYACLTAADRIG